MEKIPVRHIRALQNGSASSESFRIRDIRELLGGRDMVQELHRHDFYYLLVLNKGKGSHEIDFKPYDVRDHSIFFLRPGQAHQLTLKTGSSGYLLEFNTAFYFPHEKTSNQLLRKASNITLYSFAVDKFRPQLSICTRISEEFINQQERFLDVIKSDLTTFFIGLVRQNRTLPDVNSYIQERLEEFLGLLETQVSSRKQVSEYADLMNLSPYQLNSVTKSTLGKTCSELINDYIILESKRYLLATSNQVNQIAYHLGYEDVSYFIRFFKKHTGYTPEAFRNNFK